MDDRVDIPLSDTKHHLSLRPLQLYSLVTFRLPSLGPLSLPSLQKSQLPHPPSSPSASSLPTSFQFSYNTKYQQTLASQQFYPLCLALSEKYIAVSGKTNILVFNEIDFSSFFKIPFQELVTSMDIHQDILAIGTQSGKILLSNLAKRNVITDSTYFSHSVLKVKVLQNYKLVAIDSVGGCAVMVFNMKVILDKMIVISTDVDQIFEVSKKRNRDKIKKLWSNFMSKDKEDPASNAPQLPEYNNDFAVAYRQFSPYLNENQFCLAAFNNNKLTVSTISLLKFHMANQQTLLESLVLNQIGIIKFGVGGFQTSNQTHLFLVVSHQTTINYFRFVRVDDFYEWHHVYTTATTSSVLHGSFLSNNLLSVLTQTGIQLLAIGQQPTPVTAISFYNFNYINFFNTEHSSRINRANVYKNILRCSWKLNFLCCLEGKRIVICNIRDWKSYLEVYQNENRWEEVIRYAMEIYRGRFKLLAGIPLNKEQRKREMQSHFESVILAYISFQLNQHPEEIEKTVKLSIRFLLDIENYECLFITVYQVLKQHRDIFFRSLQSFILQGKVQNISNEALQQSISYYKSQGSSETIETLLINLNLEEVDKSMILQICLKERLFRSLINICVSTKDFITPTVKLSGLITLDPVITEEQTKANKIILSYIKNCLDGYYLDYHDDEKYLDMLSKLVTYFMLPISLKLISKTDPENFFRICELFFEGRVFQLILENSEMFTVKNSVGLGESIFEKQSCTEFEVYEKILKNIIFTEYIEIVGQGESSENGKEKNDNHDVSETDTTEAQNPKPSSNSNSQPQNHRIQLDKFLLFLILKNQFPFTCHFQIRACSFLIHHPTIFLPSPSPTTDQQQVDINAYLMRMFDSILTKLEQPLKSQQLQKFIAMIYSTAHEELLCQSLCYLYHIQGKFKKVFEIYLRMKNKELRDKILLYLEENLIHHQLVVLSLNNIISLLKIDEEKALRLFVSHLPNECQQIINKLSGYPKYQLKYLELLFKTEHSLKAELKLIHLNIVIKYEKNDVEFFLRSMDYPLDQAYRICEQANHKPAMAYLAVKKGKIRQGLTILIDIFCQLSDDTVKQLARRQTPDKTQLFLRLKQMIQVCVDLSMEDIEEGEGMWFELLEKIFKHIKIENLVKENVPLAIRELLGEIVQMILSEMCKYITVQFFIEKFAFTFSSLPINIFYKAYCSMNERLIFTIKVRNLVLTIFEFDHFEKSNTIKSYYSMGFPSTGVCSKCLLTTSESEDPKVTFRCKHTYHLGCITKFQCLICPRTQSFEEPEILRDNRWVRSAKKNKLKREKLVLFDEELEEISNSLTEEIEDLYSGNGKVKKRELEKWRKANGDVLEAEGEKREENMI